MNMSRRAALVRGGLFASVAPIALAACSAGNPLGVTIAVSLGGAQAEASAILQALTIVASSAAPVLGKAVRMQVGAYLRYLGTAVAAFTGLASGSSSVAKFAGAVVSAVARVVGVLPLPAKTSLALNEGLALISALIGGLSSIVVTTVAKPTASAVPGRMAAPIPIPVG